MMKNKNTQFPHEDVEVVAKENDNGNNGKLTMASDRESQFDIAQYKRRWRDNLDRRFLSIFLVSLAFNVILILYLSHLPFQLTADYIRKFQEHYANFVYDRQPEPAAKEEEGAEAVIGETEKKEAEKAEGEQKTETGGGEKSGRRAPAGEASGQQAAEARRAAHTKSTDEIAQEVSNKGLLGLLTGTGSAAQGDAIQDLLSDSQGGGQKNLDDVLSGISGIKTSGTASSGFGSGNGGARGSRTTGSGSGIGDMIDGLTSVQSTKFGNKTDKMVVSKSNVEVEGGKSAGRNPESVMEVINSHRAAIEYCYQRALRQNPNLKGKISLRFIISPSGSVKEVTIIASTLGDTSVESCIIAKVKSWRDFGPVDPAKGDAVFRQDYVFGY